MPRLSEHERSGAIGMLKAGVRISDVAIYHNYHSTTIERLSDRYQATGTVKIDSGLKPRMATDVKSNLRRLCIDDIYIYGIRSGQQLSVPVE